MPAPANARDPHVRMLSFCRAGIVEHLFGEIDPLSDRAVLRSTVACMARVGGERQL